MAWKNSSAAPVKGCGHAYTMQWTTHRCWCTACDQTWRLDANRGWTALPVSRVKSGEEVTEDWF